MPDNLPVIDERKVTLDCPICQKKCVGEAGLKRHSNKFHTADEVRAAVERIDLEDHPRTIEVLEKSIPVEMKIEVQPDTPDDRMNKLETKLDKLIDVVGAVVDKTSKSTQTTVTTQVTAGGIEQMIPKAWRSIVDEVLGADIALEVKVSSGGNFMLGFFLPDTIDRRAGNHVGPDFSTGLIRRASPEADVRKWSELIAANIKKTYPKFIPKS